jgi:hypothetical protein
VFEAINASCKLINQVKPKIDLLWSVESLPCPPRPLRLASSSHLSFPLSHAARVTSLAHTPGSLPKPASEKIDIPPQSILTSSTKSIYT